ncbi:hypothetical protein [Deinococcus altitudinis]|uniref:hypothetical protein n=1 Tax=Deinococcus altitudinis TaxID=468914 RepID=UPI0038923239
MTAKRSASGRSTPKYTRRALTTLTAALIGSAAAQEISTSLPLTSVGDKLMWTVGDQDLRLVVGVTGRVQLDVYSAQFDPQDYRSKTEYGDESYGGPVTSTFALIDAQGKVVKTQNFGVGSSDWQTFLNSDLAAGTYTLRVQTTGKGKNTFALRLNTISAAVEADRLNVNVHAKNWIPALNVASPGGNLSLHMYDGDGPTELEAEIRDSQGHVFPLKVSGDLASDTLTVPAPAGNYTVYLRQPASAKQYSNTVAFSLEKDGQATPLTVVRADTVGRLDVVAELVLPDGNVPTTADVTVGDRELNVNGNSELNLPAASYPVSVKPVTGAETTISTDSGSTSSVTVEKSKTAQVKVQVKPSVALNFVADKTQVCVGDVVTFTADASTTFERQPLPVSLRVTLPGGLSATGDTSLTTKVDAANRAQVRFEANATAAGTLEASASLLPWNQTQKLPIEVLPTATQIELRRAEVASALPGEVVTVSLSVRNTSGVNAPYRLVDAPGTGLTALDPVIFSGELKPGETRTLSYRARVNTEAGTDSGLKATLTSNCESSQEVSGQFVAAVPPAVVPTPPTPEAEVPAAQVPAAPAPVIVMARSSVVRIPFDAPRAATQLVVAHTPPAGATYVPGSSLLNGKPLADPVVGPSGRLYWTTPGAPRGVLGYALKHQEALPALESPALLGRYAQGRQEVLVGTIDLADLSAAETPVQATAGENAGAIKLPVAGTVFRERDRVTVAVEGGGTSLGSNTALPTINGKAVAEATLGQTTLDSAASSTRREFYGIQLRPGENVIGYGDQSVKVYLAGTPVTAQLTPVQLVADGVQPISIRLKLLDINGLTPGTPTVTVESSLDSLTPDAQPQVASQQISLKNGEGLLELPPISAPTRFTVRVLVGSGVITRSFEATPSATRVGVGFLSVTGSLGGGSVGGGFAYEGRGQGYFETPLGAGKLYVAGSAAVRGGAGQLAETVKPDGTISTDPNAPVNMSPVLDKSQGLPSTANPLLRYPGYGDSSTEQIPLQGIDPVAFRYEHPAFSASYRQSALPIDVFSIGGNLTALSGYTRSNPQVAAFVAALPGGLVTDNLPSNGTRVVRLSQSDVSPDSQSVDLVTTDRLTGAQTLSRLIPYADYTLDPVAGVLYFSRPVGLLDDAGNAQSLRVVYRVTAPDGNRQLAYGAQVSGRIGEHLNVGAAAVQIDGVLSVGVRARYDSNSGVGNTSTALDAPAPGSFGFASGSSVGNAVSGDVLAAYAGGLLVNGTLGGHTDRLNYAASLRYQDEGYVGLNAVDAGLAAAGSLEVKLNDAFGVRVAAQYADGSYQLGRTTNQTITGGSSATTGSGNQGGLISLQGRYSTGGLRLGAGVQAGFGEQQGLAALVSAGYAAGAFDVSIDHAQPLGSGTLDPVTTAAAKVQLAENLTLVAQDVIDWGGSNPDSTTDPFSQQATVGLQTRLGGTNLSVGYDLPTSSGSGNRARFGVDTTMPLGDKFSGNLGGSYLYNLTSGTGDWNAGTSLRYASDALAASVGADVASTSGVFRTVLKTGLSYSFSDQLSVTLDATKVLGAADQVGTSLALSTALRSGPLQGLAYVRYQDGSLGGSSPQVIGEANVEYHQPQFGLRAGVAGRMLLSDPGSLTFQPSVSGTYYLTDAIGVGVAGRAIFQPASNFSAYSLGLEGSLRALPGTWVTVGYNPVGFDGISSSVSTRQGVYLRLDLMLDEGESK